MQKQMKLKMIIDHRDYVEDFELLARATKLENGWELACSDQDSTVITFTDESFCIKTVHLTMNIVDSEISTGVISVQEGTMNFMVVGISVNTKDNPLIIDYKIEDSQKQIKLFMEEL